MSSSSKNTAPINLQEAPDSKLGWNKADPEDVAMVKLQEKFWQKLAWEAKEAKRCKEAEEAKKRAREAAEAEKRACKAEAWHQEVVEAKRRREAEQQKEAGRQEAKRAKEAKKWQHAESGARSSGSWRQDSKCIQYAKVGTVCMVGPGTKQKVTCDCCSHNKEKCKWPVTEIGSIHRVMSPWGGKKKKRTRRAWPTDGDNNDDDNDDVVVVSTCKTRKSESGARETMAQMVDRRMDKIVEELRSLREGMAAMAKSNQDLAQVLYHGFQSVDTLVDEGQIFGAEGFLSKLVPESEPTEDKLQEALREVEELQEECLEWAM
ncbi:hypothetical protein ID866_12265, partial [Astraeus odoratus]